VPLGAAKDLLPKAAAHREQRIVGHVRSMIITPRGDACRFELAGDFAGMLGNKGIKPRDLVGGFLEHNGADNFFDVIVLEVHLDNEAAHDFLEGGRVA
jgi:hypothetical protein